MILGFALAVSISAVLAIGGAYQARRRALHYLFKPLTTGLILGLALLLPSELSVGFRIAIAVGLLCSLAGDVFLMLPSDRFVHGLVSFLLAHLAYLLAFTIGVTAQSVALGTIPYLVAASAIVAALWPGVPAPLRVPVIVYVGFLTLMAGAALGRWAGAGIAGAGAAALGGSLFVISDTVLAWERFRRPVPIGRAITLGTYFAAQFLIALSVGR